MTVNIGDPVRASDYNTLAGLIDDWFADGCTACSFGDPTQRFGWGGSSISSVNIGDDIEAADFNAMIDRINIGASIVDSTASSIAQINIGDIIRASHYNNIENQESIIRVAKNVISASEKSIHAGTTDQRTTGWSGTIDSVIRFTFTDFDEARYFFNSGGSLLLSLGLAGGTTTNATNWANLFTAIGTVSFNIDDTTNSGASGSPTSVGYFDLTTGYQTIFSATGTGAYTDNDLTIEALRDAAGSYIDLRVTLADDHAGSVDGTTTLTAQYRKLDDQSSGSVSLTITAPIASVQDTFE